MLLMQPRVCSSTKHSWYLFAILDLAQQRRCWAVSSLFFQQLHESVNLTFLHLILLLALIPVLSPCSCPPYGQHKLCTNLLREVQRMLYVRTFGGILSETRIEAWTKKDQAKYWRNRWWDEDAQNFAKNDNDNDNTKTRQKQLTNSDLFHHHMMESIGGISRLKLFQWTFSVAHCL